MNKKAFAIILAAFLTGVFSTMAFNSVFVETNSPTATTTYVMAGASANHEEEDGAFITRILSMANEERASPYDRIAERDISVEKDKVVINLKDAQWSKFTDTNSMDPVIDAGANAIQIVPESPSEIFVGDIISYKSEYADGIIIHRVIATGTDENGWYAIVKGDNNPRQDPGKVRFSQIKRVVVAIIY